MEVGLLVDEHCSILMLLVSIRLCAEENEVFEEDLPCFLMRFTAIVLLILVFSQDTLSVIFYNILETSFQVTFKVRVSRPSESCFFNRWWSVSDVEDNIEELEMSKSEIGIYRCT